jgi:hypothetical protein
LYFNTNADAILPSVDKDALLDYRGPVAANWGAAESNELEGDSEEPNSPGQEDPPVE